MRSRFLRARVVALCSFICLTETPSHLTFQYAPNPYQYQGGPYGTGPFYAQQGYNPYAQQQYNAYGMPVQQQSVYCLR